MNTLELFMIGIIIAPLVIGLLLGFMRGSRRAILRLILVILCVALAFALNGTVSNTIMQTPVQDGMTLEQAVVSQLPEEYAAIGEALVPIVALLITAISFIMIFYLLKFVSWAIIFPICKIFVKKARKKKNGDYGSKHALLGGLIGLVQGGVVALVLCVMLNGLLYNVGNLMGAVNAFAGDNNPTNPPAAMASVIAEEGDPQGGEEQQPAAAQAGDIMVLFEDYKNSKTCQTLHNAGGDKMFNLVARVKTEDGKTLTLTGQVDAVSALVRTAKSILNLSQNLGTNLDGDLAQNIKSMFDELDDLYKNLGDESKEAVNNLLQTAASTMMPEQVNVDFSKLNFAEINFKHEGEVLSNLAAYKDKDLSALNGEEIKTAADDIVNLVIESDIILPMLSGSGEFSAGLSDEHMDHVEKIIDEMANDSTKDPKKLDMLREFFGLNDRANQGGNGDEGEAGQPSISVPEQPEESAPEQSEESKTE